MRDSFKTILIPVDFSINTEVAIKKTLEIIGPGQSTVYLLHVNNTKSVTPGQDVEEKMLEHWKQNIENSDPLVSVVNHIIWNSPVPHAIVSMAKKWGADLIVIGQKSNHSWFPFLNTVVPTDIAEQTGVAVLTVKPGALHCKIRTLVMPITGNVPPHKMEAILALSRKFKLKIHLITFTEDEKSISEVSKLEVLKVYQWIQDTMHCTIECAVLKGYNKAKAILDYAKRIDADMLLVNTKSETKIGSFNRHISNVLPAASRMQVLTL
jgi:nucleotide-binding universal stress UspA family protein